ncbi:TPA: tRNA (adenosine(37)-N6)-threonylcarbamoyltransferase complex ATPase subunit type 1 TsaE [Candidatus Dependentiae bacterium]|nr:tRNA (adenosine(37)-N6)-threonylcarbamoyltransferase complex ATPase subunit type 1 TsaE [Candidatus Dependentiae bacterium]
MNIQVYREDEIEKLLDALLPLIATTSIVMLQGPLGAGKTTLIRALLVRMGVEASHITSPTFSYVHQYVVLGGREIFHFDLYRLTSLDDFYALGFDEYLYRPNSLSCIEWPEIIMPLIARDYLEIRLDYGQGLSNRLISWEKHV